MVESPLFLQLKAKGTWSRDITGIRIRGIHDGIRKSFGYFGLSPLAFIPRFLLLMGGLHHPLLRTVSFFPLLEHMTDAFSPQWFQLGSPGCTPIFPHGLRIASRSKGASPHPAIHLARIAFPVAITIY